MKASATFMQKDVHQSHEGFIVSMHQLQSDAGKWRATFSLRLGRLLAALTFSLR